MALDLSVPTSVITPPGVCSKIKSKVWTTQTATTQANAFYLRKGSSIIKLEAQVESTNAGAVTLSIGSPTTTNHYISAYALSTNLVAQQLVAPLTNIATATELTTDVLLTAQISGAPASGKVVLNLHYVD